MQFHFITLAAILLAGDALASKISYACRYNGKDLKGNAKVVSEQKAGGTIPDDKDNDVINNIGTWSSHKFSAKKNARTGIIIVTNATPADSKSAATTENNEAQQLVTQKIK
ncbi:hypothetical protein SLS53_003530 [Cytospora paraplurivora]|uniref:Pectate lyase n=2 Tax=Cytospora TaxID=117544 RepID=A0A423VYA1_9PEZI|nr:hypothetical protein VPNG_09167 [Cytospora leucostoma]